MKAFHVTPASNINAILADGLIPAIGTRSMELGEPVPAVYLFPSEDDAADAVGNWLGECFEDEEELALLTVDIAGLSYSQELEYELIITDEIPAHRVQVLYSSY